MKIRLTLSIGYANSKHEDIIDVPQDEWDDCETEEQRDELLSQYWQDWSNNFIDGGCEVVEEVAK